ncbi:MAG: ROK family protein [Elusimicrobiota bacterium]|jgi:glucokinase|nr:ROK family protein [Elusimicrobiota bacterium]
MSEEYFLGIDMGGTSIKIAIVNDAYQIIDTVSLPTDPKKEPQEVLQEIISAASKLAYYEKVNSIGMGIAGNLDFEHGVLIFSCNLPKWRNTPIKTTLEKISGKKVFVDNDGNTAAIGSYFLDAHQEANNLVCLTLGTGIGCGYIIDKKMYRGSRYIAGEIGHCTVILDGTPCGCGNKGCLEAYLGVKHISQYAVEYLAGHPSEIISRMSCGDPAKITPALLHKAAVENDEVAKDILNWTGRFLGVLLMSVINYIDPDTIVLCGGLSQAGKYILDPAYEHMRKSGFAQKLPNYNILISKYTSKLGVVGCAMLPSFSNGKQ